MAPTKEQFFKPFTTLSCIHPTETQRLTEIGSAFSDPQVLVRLKQMSELARTGALVKAGSRKPRNRKHDLGDLIERTYLALAADGREPNAEQVFNALEEHDEEEIIQEICGDRIDWIDWQGNQHDMKFSTLRNRLTEIRKRQIRKRHSQS